MFTGKSSVNIVIPVCFNGRADAESKSYPERHDYDWTKKTSNYGRQTRT